MAEKSSQRHLFTCAPIDCQDANIIEALFVAPFGLYVPKSSSQNVVCLYSHRSAKNIVTKHCLFFLAPFGLYVPNIITKVLFV